MGQPSPCLSATRPLGGNCWLPAVDAVILPMKRLLQPPIPVQINSGWKRCSTSLAYMICWACYLLSASRFRGLRTAGIYPLSNSAQSVVEVFASAVSLAGVTLSTQTRITGLQISSKGIIVRSTQNGKEQENEFERVIVSAGGCAYPSLGSRGELFPELKRLGHTVLPNRPALAPILANLGSLQPLQGIRLNVGASLWKGSQCFATSRGNLIFTEWGLNGPAVMDISHIVSAQPDADLELSLNFLAFFPDEFDQLLAQKRKSSILLGVFLDAFFPPKVSAIILRNARLSGQTAMNQTSDSVLDQLANNLKDTRLTVKGTRDFEFCQISAGGVPVNEVDPRTLESRLIKGLYLTGETLDVIGPCGGYNLQYAFSSGALAGKAAAG